MGKRNFQIVLAVVVLIVFGYKALNEITEWSPNSRAALYAVTQLLPGVFLFWWGKTARLIIPSTVGGVVKTSGAVGCGLTVLGYALAFPCEAVSLFVSRLGLAIVLVWLHWKARGKIPKRFGAWLRMAGEIILVYILACMLVQSGSYGFEPFYHLKIRFAHLFTVRIADLLAWASVLVIAWFARWAAERPSDRRRWVAYWCAVGACCTGALCGHLAGVALVLFGAGATGALLAFGSLPGRSKIRGLMLQVILSFGVLVFICCLVCLLFPEGLARMRGFVFSEANRYSLGYSYAKLDRLIGLIPFSQGISDYLPFNTLLPDAWNGCFLITVAAIWGWESMVFFAGVSIWLCWLLMDGCRRIDDLAVRSAAGVLTSVLILQFVIGMLQNVGWIPMLNVCQPFTGFRVLPFCANAFFLGLLFRMFPSAPSGAKSGGVWPLLTVPLLVIVVGSGLYAWRDSETCMCLQKIEARQAQLREYALVEADRMLSDIADSGELGEYGECDGVDQKSPLSRCMSGMVASLKDIGKREEAVQRMEEALALVQSIQPDDSEVVADLLVDYAGCVDRVGDFEKSQHVYETVADMRLRMKQREDPTVVTRVVYIDSVRAYMRGYWARLCCGDHVLTYDDRPIMDAHQLSNRMTFDAEHKTPGGTRLVVLRNGREVENILSFGPLGICLRNGWLHRDGHVESCQE